MPKPWPPDGEHRHEEAWQDEVTGWWYVAVWDAHDDSLPGEVILERRHPDYPGESDEIYLPFEALRQIVELHKRCPEPHSGE